LGWGTAFFFRFDIPFPGSRIERNLALEFVPAGERRVSRRICGVSEGAHPHADRATVTILLELSLARVGLLGPAAGDPLAI
jgi:hypothetical protein